MARSEKHYRTYRGFHRAMARYGDRVAYWFGDDYAYVIVLKAAS